MPSHQLAEAAKLTPRQREVLALVAQGLTNPEIAARLGITRDGVKWHLSEILARLGLDTREEAADVWRRYNGLPYRLHRLTSGVMGASITRWIAVGLGGVAVAGSVLAIVALTPSNTSRPNVVAPVTSRATPTVPGSANSSSTIPPALTPTGVSGVDQTMQALRSHSAAAIRARFKPQPIACEPTPLGIGSPPACPTGSPAGTLVDTIPSGSCESAYITDLDGYARDLAASGVAVYAALKTPTREASPYLLILRYPQVSVLDLYLDADGLVVRIHGACGADQTLDTYLHQPGYTVLAGPMP